MQTESSKAHDSLNILVIDNVKTDLMSCRSALKSAWGDKVRLMEADCGESGLEIIEKHPLNCVLLDYLLPGRITGIEVLKCIRIEHPYLAVVMIDRKGGDPAIAVQALQEGAQDYVPKTNIAPSLIRRISENAMEKAALQQKEARQREDLENFARILVHDLKAPTRSIQGFARLLEQSIEDGVPEKAAGHCRRVIEAAQRMDELIDTLYEYTKTDERIMFASVEMRQVVKDALSNLEHLIHKRGAHVTYDALPAVNGHGPQLTQLLQNLVGNSIKYCETETPSIHISANPQEGNVWLVSVKDNGIGIPREGRQRVFETFRRLHGDSKFQGAGLGLATCKKIVERHAGAIWCESENGQGSTFYFTLRAADPHV